MSKQRGVPPSSGASAPAPAPNTPSWISDVLDFVAEHPIATSVAAAGIAALIVLAGQALLAPTPTFRAPKDAGAGDSTDASKRLRFADDAELPQHMRQLVAAVSSVDNDAVFEQVIEAVHSLRAEGVFEEQEAAVMGQTFAGLARAGSLADASHLQLSRNQVRFVLTKVGIRDPAVADRIFAAWNTDGKEGIDLKEFLHAVVLVMSGTPTQKLEMVYRIMDIDADGWVSKAEMARFLATVYASSGQRRSPDVIDAQVERMYAHAGKRRMGFLSKDEFLLVAHDAKFHVGETLTAFLHDLTERFSESLGAAAGEYRGARAAAAAARGSAAGPTDLGDDDAGSAAAAAATTTTAPMKRASSVYK